MLQIDVRAPTGTVVKFIQIARAGQTSECSFLNAGKSVSQRVVAANLRIMQTDKSRVNVCSFISRKRRGVEWGIVS